MARVSYALVCALAAVAVAAPFAAASPREWTLAAPASDELMARVQLHLTHRLPHRSPSGAAPYHGPPMEATSLEAACTSVSDPASPHYGQHLTLKEVAKVVSDGAAVAAVRAWLGGQGLASSAVSVSKSRDVIEVVAPAAKMGALFGGAPVHVYSHVDEPTAQIVRVAAPASAARAGAGHAVDAVSLLPEQLRRHVRLVVGATDFPSLYNVPAFRARVAARKRVALKAAEAAEAAAAAVRDDGPPLPGPNEPLVMFIFLNTTVAHLQFAQPCPTALNFSSTPLPCTGPGQDPITSYTVRAYYEGASGPVDTTVDPADMTHSGVGPMGGFLVYTLAAPVPAPWKKVHYYLQAHTKSGASSNFSSVSYANTSLADQGLLPGPMVPPNDLRAFYGYDAVDTSSHSAGNSQSVAEFDGQFYDPTDLKTYMQRFGVKNDATVTLVGPNNASSEGGEAQLDIELIMGLAPNVDTTFWSVAEHAPKPPLYGFVLEWAVEMNNATSAPLVTSISYGGPEAMFAQAFGGPGYLESTNAELLKMCMRGLTVVLADGDAGSTNKGHGASSCAVQANYPSDSPWVTSVSASQMNNKAEPRGVKTGPFVGLGESAVSVPLGRLWTTGGGIGNMSTNARPWYQQANGDPVAQYLKGPVGKPPAGMYNASGRGYPDVAVIGHAHSTVMKGLTAFGDGTSAAAPAFAAGVSLLNAARLKAGKSPVGFLNPALYTLFAKTPAAFYDIQIGENRCGQMCCCPYGWSTGPQWDAVTGLGNPMFPQLLAFVMALP